MTFSCSRPFKTRDEIDFSLDLEDILMFFKFTYSHQGLSESYGSTEMIAVNLQNDNYIEDYAFNHYQDNIEKMTEEW